MGDGAPMKCAGQDKVVVCGKFVEGSREVALID